MSPGSSGGGLMIAVLLAAYQGGPCLEAQLDSILAQTVPNIRIIISHNGSDDCTRQVLEQYKKYYPRQILLRPRVKEGRFRDREPFIPASAMNFFWLMAQTDADYVLLSNQDDVWDSLKVKKLLKKMKETERPGHPALVYSDMEVVDEELRQINPSFFSYSRLNPGPGTFSRLLTENTITGGSMMMNRALLHLARQIPHACFMRDWWIALCASCFGDISCVRESLSLYRLHDACLSGIPTKGSPEELLARDEQTAYENYRRIFRQAAAFGKQYQKQMKPEDRAALRAFLSLPGQTPSQRLRTIAAYRLFKSSWIGTVGQCVTIPVTPGTNF